MGIGRWVAAGLGVVGLASAGAYAQYRNTEEPGYEVVRSQDDFELRRYEPMIVAEITHKGDRQSASGRSFRRLAAYIFAQDRPAGGEQIAMTAPVLQKRVADQNEPIAMTAPVLQEEVEADEWRMRFVMPARFTMETLPQPPSDIALKRVPARNVAAVRFSGVASRADLSVMEAMLSQWLKREGLMPQGDFEYAFYDAPMVPGPLRRNEVLIEIAAE